MKEDLRQDINLAGLRQALKQARKSLAEVPGLSEEDVPGIEKNADRFLNLLRQHLETAGARLEITAVFSDGAVNIADFSSLLPPKSPKGSKYVVAEDEEEPSE
jgi:hypothetical protein